MNATKLAIFITLHAIFVNSKKHYIVPAPNTIIELLEKFHHIRIKRRWLFYCMLYLRVKKHIRMRRRWLQIQGKGILSQPSMITITTKGAQFLKSKMIAGSRELFIRMKKFLEGDDKRFPLPQDINPDEPAMNRDRLRIMIKEFIKTIP